VAHDDRRSSSQASDDSQVSPAFVDALSNAASLYESYMSSAEVIGLIGYYQATRQGEVLTGGFDVPLTLQISTFRQ